jgi:uncharacterized protein (TIGR03905 family)
MKRIIIIATMLFAGSALFAQQKNMEVVQNPQVSPAVQTIPVVDDYQVISDEVRDGVRYVTATPSAKVCSKKIEIEIVDGIIRKVVYTRGCEGNAKGIGALIKDMSVEEAIRRLEGITCGKRGTSCPDQLARILKSLS